MGLRSLAGDGASRGIGQRPQDVIREFLVESHENLSRLDQEIVELEKHPKDTELLASIFRTFHTIKGMCGYLAFSTLERIAHQAESLLSGLRDGHRELSPALVSLILETVDLETRLNAGQEMIDDHDARISRERHCSAIGYARGDIRGG